MKLLRLRLNRKLHVAWLSCRHVTISDLDIRISEVPRPRHPGRCAARCRLRRRYRLTSPVCVRILEGGSRQIVVKREQSANGCRWCSYVTPALLLSSDLPNAVELEPAMVCAELPLKVTVRPLLVNVELFVQLPSTFMLPPLELDSVSVPLFRTFRPTVSAAVIAVIAIEKR